MELTRFLQLKQVSEFRGGTGQAHGDHREVNNSSWARGSRGKEHHVSTGEKTWGPRKTGPVGGDEEAGAA